MTVELAIVLGLLALAILMFAINRPRMDAVALIMLVALPLSGVITVPESLAGFSDPNIVLIAALFVIGDGLVRTGVALRLGDWLSTVAGSSETRLVALLMIVVCLLGSFMSSTAVTAIFVPVALRIAQATGASAGRLMMPISVSALISGMMTLVATAPNLVVSSELERNGFSGFHFFAFTPFGLPILILGIVYMAFARRWLGDGSPSRPISQSPRLSEWIEQYGLAAREHRVAINRTSPLVGSTLQDLRSRGSVNARIVAIERGKQLLEPSAAFQFAADDVLLVDADSSVAVDAEKLRRDFDLRALPLSGGYFSDRSQEIGMAEVLIPPTSSLVDKTLIESQFLDEYGLRVIGLRRGRDPILSAIDAEDLRIGDALLLIGPWRSIRNLQTHGREMVVFGLPAEMEEVLPVAGRAWHAVGCLALVVALMVSGVVPNVLAALIGCLLMGLLGITDLNSAYRSIDWKTIVLIVGMLPFSIALQRTGGVELLADGLMGIIGGAGPRVVIASVFAITALLGMFISNTATAVLMAPVALAIANDLGASPYPFAMTVALAASTAFMTPVSSPVNTLVVTPGNYTFGDFLKIGVPFSLLVMLFCVALLPVVFPLG